MPTRPAPPALHAATTAENDAVAATLARAFLDDPVTSWLLPADHHERRLRTFFGTELEHAHRHGMVLTTHDHAGAALWLPPRRWKVDLTTTARELPTYVRSLGRRIPAGLAIQHQMEKAHPAEEHWYLAVLGTDPEHQGRGIGAALITTVTDRCDATGVGAYLESSKPSNVPYYERFGFVVTGDFTALDSPVLHTMWRDPR